jgi:hypothetical protein
MFDSTKPLFPNPWVDSKIILFIGQNCIRSDKIKGTVQNPIEKSQKDGNFTLPTH